jgi:hypothetical protein
MARATSEGITNRLAPRNHGERRLMQRITIEGVPLGGGILGEGRI